MKVLVVRADANPQIGWGHVLRSLALAQAWQDAGGNAAFVCAQLPESLRERLNAEDCHVVSINTEIGSLEDAVQTRQIARGSGASWVACDGYNFDGDWLRSLQCDEFSLCVADDFSTTDLSAANVILNPNAGATPELYVRFAADATVLFGADYALLRREFRLCNRVEKTISPNVARVLIAMGGADIGNLVPRALNWLENQTFRGEVVVLSGARSFDLPEFGFGLRIINAQSEVPQWMSWCDVAIAAAGATTWELACCGTPAILSVVAENQRPLARWCELNGVAVNTGEANEAWEMHLAKAWQKLEHFGVRRAMSLGARNAIDGQGAVRVVEQLLPDALQLRAVIWEDARLLWQWRNDPQTRAMSLQSDFVHWETHETWLRARLNDDNTLLWMAHQRGENVGVVRFARDGEVATISVMIAPDWRGRGVGTALIGSSCRALLALWDVRQIRAQIKTCNLSSRRAFEKVGFCCETESLLMSQLLYSLERPR